MIFATISTPHASRPPRPALISNDRVYSLPFADLHAVIEVGAQEAATRASNKSFAMDEVKFHAPLHPTSLRDAYAFEQHVKAASQNRGKDVPEAWYKFPTTLDFELEVAVIVGKAGINIKAEDAHKHIFGYTIFNDWSTQDVQ